MDASLAAAQSSSGVPSLSLRLPAEGFASHSLAQEQSLIVYSIDSGLRVRDGAKDVARARIDLSGQPKLIVDNLAPEHCDSAVIALLEALFACQPDIASLAVALPQQADISPLLASGALISTETGLVAKAQAVFQLATPWLGNTPPAYPDLPVMTNGILHPLRPPKPTGAVYRRFIPWLNTQLGFHVADREADLPHFHRWMNDPRVAAIWEDDGTLDQHRAFIDNRLADPRTLPLIGTFGGVPFGYFELYWAKEDRLGPHYEAESHDRGWHVAIGEDAFRGKAFVSAWLPSLMHYMFLADPRTNRIVGEPIHHHQQQIRNLDRSGFAKIKHVQFSHKKALLVMLLRERFFADQLLSPDLTGLADTNGYPVLGSLARGGQ